MLLIVFVLSWFQKSFWPVAILIISKPRTCKLVAITRLSIIQYRTPEGCCASIWETLVYNKYNLQKTATTIFCSGFTTTKKNTISTNQIQSYESFTTFRDKQRRRTQLTIRSRSVRVPASLCYFYVIVQILIRTTCESSEKVRIC